MKIKKDTLIVIICIMTVALCLWSFWLISELGDKKKGNTPKETNGTAEISDIDIQEDYDDAGDTQEDYSGIEVTDTENEDTINDEIDTENEEKDAEYREKGIEYREKGIEYRENGSDLMDEEIDSEEDIEDGIAYEELDLTQTELFEKIIRNTSNAADEKGYSLQIEAGYPKNQGYQAKLEVYNGVVHIEKSDESGKADIYLDKNSDVTYTNIGYGWVKELGVYYGAELYPSFEEIGNNIKSYNQVALDENGIINLKRGNTLLNIYYDTDTYLINSLETVLKSGYRQYYTYDFSKDNKIEIPESVLQNVKEPKQ